MVFSETKPAFGGRSIPFEKTQKPFLSADQLVGPFESKGSSISKSFDQVFSFWERNG